ncbi:Hypothetical Protein FCC1311_051462 [Hondaea fermentalgiana]|uniref:YqaJ viral recombinase domain-containing protein n=1 Tax=Hondaea fermentalgiana TaxID=2315210 RepID=A0A2R5GEE5_9STRA|nr:Hypothetical Protein FCC1311_051462 [Hondaea fermentalgiana]|eukprot:GBG28925.1 Hypothetical Protein FCC1311_051462 [Hondaea fermentalgiana]
MTGLAAAAVSSHREDDTSGSVDDDDVDERDRELAAARARLEAARQQKAALAQNAKILRAELRALRDEQLDLEDDLFRELTGTGLILSSVVQGSTRWNRTRTERFTASQFGVVCGVSRYARGIDLWMLRTGRIENPFRGNADTERGNLLEPVALRWYERAYQEHVQTTGFWVCQEASYLGASPDGLVGDDGLLEIKCPRHAPHTSVPSHYMAQIQGQLHITKRKWCDFVSYHEKEDPVVLRVYYSPSYWAWMLPQLRAFYFHIQTDEPPPKLPLENLTARQKQADALCRVEPRPRE